MLRCFRAEDSACLREPALALDRPVHSEFISITSNSIEPFENYLNVVILLRRLKS